MAAEHLPIPANITPVALDAEVAKRLALRKLKPLPGQTLEGGLARLVDMPLTLTRVWGPRPPTAKSISDRDNYALELVDGNGVVLVVWSNHDVLARTWNDDTLRTALELGATFRVMFAWHPSETKGRAGYFTIDFLEE